MKIPLSENTRKHIAALFAGEDLRRATELLVDECGSNLPFCGDKDPESMERIRFAALKLSEGKLDLLLNAIVLAQQDWRDLLVAAGFGSDPEAHKRWLS